MLCEHDSQSYWLTISYMGLDIIYVSFSTLIEGLIYILKRYKWSVFQVGHSSQSQPEFKMQLSACVVSQCDSSNLLWCTHEMESRSLDYQFQSEFLILSPRLHMKFLNLSKTHGTKDLI